MEAQVEVLNRYVEEVELGNVFNEHGERIENFRGVYPKSHNNFMRPLAIVSKKYKLINHNTVFSCIKDLIVRKKLNVKVVKCEATYDKTYHQIMTKSFVTLLLDKVSDIEPNVGDVVQYGVKIANAIDGKMSLSVFPFSYRLKCLNGAVVIDHSEVIKFKHLLTLNETILEGAINNVIGSFETITEKYKEWTNIEISLSDIQNEQNNIIKLVGKKMYEKILITKIERAWDLYNLLTYENSHTIHRNPYSKLLFDSNTLKVIDLLTNKT